jgi:response regulator RpfG family c-di-GMP phosphodiesterase
MKITGKVMKTILVIDDDPDRIEWLTRFIPDAQVILCLQKQQFIDASKQPHDLVVFEHDIGSFDNGAIMAQAYEGPTTTPILIWSFSHIGVNKITCVLRDKGHTDICVFPFLACLSSNDYAEMIREIAGIDC